MNNNYLEIEIMVRETNYYTIYQVAGADYNEVDINSIKIQDRADWAFVRGSFKIVTSRITQNISPYSLCRIRTLDDTGTALDSNYYLITSRMTHNFTKNVYIHECSLMSLEAILECFILGTKSYTYDTNKDVVLHSIVLNEEKYNYHLSYDITTLDNAGSSDYTFGTGTTIYEVCKQVAERTNTKFYVDLSEWSISWNYVIKFYNPTTPSTLTIDNTSTFVLNIIKSQDSDNYCKFIETEASNVVDRDITTKWKDLSVRSTYIRADTEHQQLVLPTNVEAINKFIVKGDFLCEININLPGVDIPSSILSNYEYDEYGYGGTTTYQRMINANISYDDHDNIFQYLYDEFLYKYGTGVLTASFDIWVYLLETRRTIKGNLNISEADYTDYIVEEQYFNTLSENDRSHYCMYKSGSNIIDNMNASYRDNLWGLITGQSQYNFLTQTVNDEFILDLYKYVKVEISADTTYHTASEYIYDVEATTMTDPIIIDKKDSVEENEYETKPIGRSYQMGDSNGMPIYFDALINDMDKQNETLGRIEAIVDIDTSKFTIANMPKANQPVSLYGTTFYISSLEHRFTASRRYTQLNLSKTPYKIADAIGVDYQYNSIKIPTQSVVERKLYYEIEDDDLWDDIYNDKQVFLVLQSGNDVFVAKRVAISSDSRDAYYLYCEAMDNYSFDKSISGDVVSDVPYSDNNGKRTTYDIYVLTADSLTSTISKSLPYATSLWSAGNDIYTVQSNATIYKDTREKLTFTIKVMKEE